MQPTVYNNNKNLALEIFFNFCRPAVNNKSDMRQKEHNLCTYSVPIQDWNSKAQKFMCRFMTAAHIAVLTPRMRDRTLPGVFPNANTSEITSFKPASNHTSWILQ